jgi:hypothetical protein
MVGKIIKKGEIALEELVRLIIFLISVTVIGIIFSKILIPKIFEKNNELMCKYYISLKNDESAIKKLMGYFASPICVSYEKEFLVSSSDEVLYRLLIYLGKTCEIINFNKEDLEICPFILDLKPVKDITINKEEIESLIYAKIPFNNEVLLDFCNHQPIVVEKNLNLEKYKTKQIKICYKHENGQGYVKVVFD